MPTLALLALAGWASACGDPGFEEESPAMEATQHSVVLGTVEPDERFPWVVRVGGTLSCHGVLVEPRWVLTAAHCIDR